MDTEIKNLELIKEKTKLYTNSLVHIFIPWGLAVILLGVLPNSLSPLVKVFTTILLYLFVFFFSYKIKEFYSKRIGEVVKKENTLDQIIKQSGYLIILFIILFIYKAPADSYLLSHIMYFGIGWIGGIVLLILTVLYLVRYLRGKGGEKFMWLNGFGANFLLITSLYLSVNALEYIIDLPFDMRYFILGSALLVIAYKRSALSFHYTIAGAITILLSIILRIDLLKFIYRLPPEEAYGAIGTYFKIREFFEKNMESPLIFISIILVILGIIDHFILVKKFKKQSDE